MTGGIIVVLGSTGRNFAAGMSGGVAYVLDEEGDFAQHCNLAMVELESLAASTADHEAIKASASGESLALDDIMNDMTRDDLKRLHLLIERHRHYTGSDRAQHILDHWADYAPRFVKVMPVDYRQALEKRRLAETVSLASH
jgi:glutamate synthase (NADPH/NADH) large chain